MEEVVEVFESCSEGILYYWLLGSFKAFRTFNLLTLKLCFKIIYVEKNSSINFNQLFRKVGTYGQDGDYLILL